MTFTYFVGVDLAQTQDYTAIAVLEEWLWVGETEAYQQINVPAAGWVSPASLTSHQIEALRSLNYYQGRPPDPPLVVGHLERLKDTPYPDVVERVSSLLQTPPLRAAHTVLLVDQTGIGRPVVDAMRRAGLSPKAVTITAGTQVNRDADTGDFRTPKRDLIATLAVLLEQRRLKITARLPEAEALRGELEQFRRKTSPDGSDTYSSWRESAHDDLVLAIAIAAWYRGWLNSHIDQANADIERRRLGPTAPPLNRVQRAMAGM